LIHDGVIGADQSIFPIPLGAIAAPRAPTTVMVTLAATGTHTRALGTFPYHLTAIGAATFAATLLCTPTGGTGAKATATLMASLLLASAVRAHIHLAEAGGAAAIGVPASAAALHLLAAIIAIPYRRVAIAIARVVDDRRVVYTNHLGAFAPSAGVANLWQARIKIADSAPS